MASKTNKQIKAWMSANRDDFIDARTGEINLTGLVEAWDSAEGTGDETLDEDHPAWGIAVEIDDG